MEHHQVQHSQALGSRGQHGASPGPALADIGKQKTAWSITRSSTRRHWEAEDRMEHHQVQHSQALGSRGQHGASPGPALTGIGKQRTAWNITRSSTRRHWEAEDSMEHHQVQHSQALGSRGQHGASPGPALAGIGKQRTAWSITRSSTRRHWEAEDSMEHHQVQHSQALGSGGQHGASPGPALAGIGKQRTAWCITRSSTRRHWEAEDSMEHHQVQHSQALGSRGQHGASPGPALAGIGKPRTAWSITRSSTRRHWEAEDSMVHYQVQHSQTFGRKCMVLDKHATL
ncbi:uncharacterized protein LOC121325481 isoform X2 [Polyodon spathula]|uniref:uncharacterized protein LOC121325481 isoform X2 n=1 Tax=Polyodon spathula TaxID=7913 RepID=UPI001B7EF94D|nr:uncharacterized protein LOC121325481 isoform X2 [Polyodon spathula]